jgi:hypothetical protein
LTPLRPQAERGPAPDAGSPAAPHIELAEVFVRADLEERRTFDLLCIAAVEWAGDDREPLAREFVVLGPESLRSHATPSAHGLSVLGIDVGPAGPDVRSVSVLLLRVQRRPRLREIGASIQDLGELLAYTDDREGSNAVAATIVGRLEGLAAMQGVALAAAGVIERAAQGDAHYLLARRGVTSSELDPFEVRDDQLVSTGSDGRATAWREDDFVLVKIGRPRPRERTERTIHELRREHALVEVEPGAEVSGDDETYSSRTARARQSRNAAEIVRAALDDDADVVAATVRLAVAQPGASHLVDGISTRISSPRAYWKVDAALESVADAADVTATVRDAVELARTRLTRRLDALLFRAENQDLVPVVTPLVLEIGDDLVPIVDSRQDDGLFLYQLVPEMRDRVRASTGVAVPGVRARGNPGLTEGRFLLQVHEVTVQRASVNRDASFVLRPAEPGAALAGAELTDVHPLSGERGLWVIEEGAGAVDGNDRLSSPQYLVRHIELVLRTRPSRFLGLQEVAGLVETWSKSDESGLVQSVVPDIDAQLRLAWLLQALVDDGLPVLDWQAILETARDRGLSAQPGVLYRSVRARLRADLQPPWSPETTFVVPPELEEALLRTDEPGLQHRARHEFSEWLRATQRDHGPALALVASSDETREFVAMLSTPGNRLIRTFTGAELGPQ